MQTLDPHDRADYFFDVKTHLLAKVVYYSGDKPVSTILLADYGDVDGLQMPSEIVLVETDGNFKYGVKFQFNVDYNEDIFQKPPPFEDGPEAWKKKN